MTDLHQEIKKIRDDLLAYICSQYTDSFTERSYYAETYTALALALQQLQTQELQTNLIATYHNKDWKSLEQHDEFNLYALSRYAEVSSTSFTERLTFKKVFLRKVSNWVLLRSLTRIREGNILQRVLGHCEARIVLRLNQYNSYITDNSLRMVHMRSKSTSSQYHAFATLIVGLLYTQSNHSFYKKHFLQAVDTLLEEMVDGDINTVGRGRKQLFGYAASVYLLSIAQTLSQEKKVYTAALQNTIDILKKWQLPNGNIPLILAPGDTAHLRHSYNNDLDYAAFAAWCLSESLHTKAR